MKKLLPNAVIGHSDHTPDLYTSFAVVALGAKIIEKHVILDKKIRGPDQSVSIDFYDLRQLVDGVRRIELALGDQKKIHENEIPIRRWAFRSIVSTRKLHKGEKITEDMIWSKRPGTGIPSHRMLEVIGKTLSHDIEQNIILRWEDFLD
jgi:N-acetylneuraminate synthase